MNSIQYLHKGYRHKWFSPEEIITDCLQKVKARENELRSFITITEDEAVHEAKNITRAFEEGRLESELAGVPVSYKDIINTKGTKTTNGSWIDKDYVPEEDAEVVTNLKSRGAITLGKNNLHEYAFGITSKNPFYGDVVNPWHEDYMVGGSSGGSAAAVAAGFCYGSVGTDTSGSIRIPASCTGIVGLKPTYGLISTEGIFPLSTSLDHAGPMANYVSDVSLLLHGMQKNAPGKPQRERKPFKLGVPKQYFNEGISAEVQTVYDQFLENCRSMGAELIEVDTDFFNHSMSLARIIAAPEVTLAHQGKASLDDYAEDIGATFERGENASALEYLEALQHKKEMTLQLSSIFTQVDILVTPTLPITPPRLGKNIVSTGEDISDAMTRYTTPFDITGHPALSMPGGLSGGQLPVGVQLVGGWYQEATVLQLAAEYEKLFLTPFYEQREKRCMTAN